MFTNSQNNNIIPYIFQRLWILLAPSVGSQRQWYKHYKIATALFRFSLPVITNKMKRTKIGASETFFRFGCLTFYLFVLWRFRSWEIELTWKDCYFKANVIFIKAQIRTDYGNRKLLINRRLDCDAMLVFLSRCLPSLPRFGMR